MVTQVISLTLVINTDAQPDGDHNDNGSGGIFGDQHGRSNEYYVILWSRIQSYRSDEYYGILCILNY